MSGPLSGLGRGISHSSAGGWPISEFPLSKYRNDFVPEGGAPVIVMTHTVHLPGHIFIRTLPHYPSLAVPSAHTASQMAHGEKRLVTNRPLPGTLFSSVSPRPELWPVSETAKGGS